MAANSNKAMSDMMDEARSMLLANPMIAPQMEQFWKAQRAILEEGQAFSKAWFERRQEAIRTALDAVRKVNDGNDPGAAMQAMAEWQQGSFQRLTDDMQDWFELCSHCAGPIAEAEVEASEEGVKEATKRAKSATNTNTNTKHSTPV